MTDLLPVPRHCAHPILVFDCGHTISVGPPDGFATITRERLHRWRCPDCRFGHAIDLLVRHD